MSRIRRQRGRLFSSFLLVGILAGVSLPGSATAQELIRQVRCRWTVPNYGTPVHHFVVVVEKFHEDEFVSRKTYDDVFEQTLLLPLEYSYSYRFHTKSVDAANRESDWSVWSPWVFPDALLSEHLND